MSVALQALSCFILPSYHLCYRSPEVSWNVCVHIVEVRDSFLIISSSLCFLLCFQVNISCLLKFLRTLDLKKAGNKIKLCSLTKQSSLLVDPFTSVNLFCLGVSRVYFRWYTPYELHRLSPVTSSALKKIHLLYSSFFENTPVDIIFPENYLWTF